MSTTTERRRRSTRPLKVGLFLPTMSVGLEGRIPRWSDLRTAVRLAEDVGFDSVWVADELLWLFDDAPPVGNWEGWTLVAAMAAETQHVEIGPLVSCVNYRNPALLAKMADTVDEISGGRLVLGLGAGWSEREYRAFGFAWEQHFARFEEGVAIIHELLRDGVASVEGRYHRLHDALLQPRGPRGGRIPMLIGGSGRRTMRLAARYADVWNCLLVGRATAEAIPPRREALDAACAEVGRDPATLSRSAAVMACLFDSSGRLGPDDWCDGSLRGSADELAAQIRAFAAEGLDRLEVGVLPATPRGIEAFAEVLELLDRDEDGT